MNTLLIVDGSNLLFQMFYGMPARITGKNGRPIHGTLGFVGALRKILQQVSPTHVVVLFDGECGNVRTALDENYKANRPDYSELPEEELPFSQLPDIYAALDFMGIAHRETTCCETDDWIAAYALTYKDTDKIIICSYDSDFFQLVCNNVTVLRYRGKESTFWDVPYLTQKLGIAPHQYADYKSLTGDTADNIPGVPKVGPKTAAALLNRFGCLETLLANTAQISKPSIRAAVEAAKARILTNYQLIRLTNSHSLPIPLEELTYTPKNFTTGEILSGIGLK